MSGMLMMIGICSIPGKQNTLDFLLCIQQAKRMFAFVLLKGSHIRLPWLNLRFNYSNEYTTFSFDFQSGAEYFRQPLCRRTPR